MQRVAYVFVVATAAALLAAAAPARACTAVQAVDAARKTHGSPTTSAARAVAIEFIEGEGWIHDPWTVDAGTGALLNSSSTTNSAGWGEKPVRNGGRSPEDWRAFMREAYTMHGLTLKGETSWPPEGWTVRDHVRLHVCEVDSALRDREHWFWDRYADVNKGFEPPADVGTGSYPPQPVSLPPRPLPPGLGRGGPGAAPPVPSTGSAPAAPNAPPAPSAPPAGNAPPAVPPAPLPTTHYAG